MSAVATDPVVALDATGTLRVGGTRVTLLTVVEAHNAGASAADIAERYDVLSPAVVAAALDHYARHRDELDRALDAHRAEAEETRRQLTASQGSQAGLKARLLARLAGGADAAAGG